MAIFFMCFAVVALVLLFALRSRWQLKRSEEMARRRIADLAPHVDNFSAAAVAKGYPAIRPGQDATVYVKDIKSQKIHSWRKQKGPM